MTLQQLSLNLSFRPALEREDYLVSECNNEAISIIDQWPNWPAPAIVIHAPKNSGKTHLAHVWQSISKAEFITLENTQENRFDIGEIKEGGAYIIDQVEKWLTSHGSQELLFHLYNGIKNNNASLLITAEEPLSHQEITLPDLRSRLLSCPHIAIHEPDDDLLGGLLVKLSNDRQLILPPECLYYSINRMERSFKAAYKFIQDVDNLSLAEKRKITIPLIKRIFEKHENENQSSLDF
jgi:chromosomal replication initiation ATPase DnaA